MKIKSWHTLKNKHLKTCPFCGYRPRYYWHWYKGSRYYEIVCGKKNCLHPSIHIWHTDRVVLETIWNRRFPKSGKGVERIINTQIMSCPGTDKCHIYSGSCVKCFRSVYGGKDNFRPQA